MKKATKSILIEMAGSIVAIAGYIREVIFLFRARDNDGKFYVPECNRSLNTSYSASKQALPEKTNVVPYRKVSAAPRMPVMAGARRARR